MPIETVRVQVLSDALPPALVDGVGIRVFDESGASLLTSGVTGDVLEGQVEFSLEGDDPPVRYQLRLHVNGGSVVSPQLIDVYSPPAAAPTGSNNFSITAGLFDLPPSPNPRMCRCSGVVRRSDGRPFRGAGIHFLPLFNPLVVDGEAVLGERVMVRADASGYVQVDLYRHGLYRATVESHENVQREVVVPDRASVNINHLLFPVVAQATFDPVGPWTVAVGANLDIYPTITASDFRTLEGTASDDVHYTIDDPSIANVTVRGQFLSVRGVAPGTTTLRVARADRSIVYIPDPGVGGAAIAITVA